MSAAGRTLPWGTAESRGSLGWDARVGSGELQAVTGPAACPPPLCFPGVQVTSRDAAMTSLPGVALAKVR